ncbi:hypothetical protein KF840_19435 [bacterium]|nr:hypothetical protein [bacterium]
MATIRSPLSGWNVPDLTSSVDELLETLEYVATLLPANADPKHERRLLEAARRVDHTRHMLICG